MRKRLLAIILSSVMILSGTGTVLATDGEEFFEEIVDFTEVDETTEDAFEDDIEEAEEPFEETDVTDEIGNTELSDYEEDSEDMSLDTDFESLEIVEEYVQEDQDDDAEFSWGVPGKGIQYEFGFDNIVGGVLTMKPGEDFQVEWWMEPYDDSPKWYISDSKVATVEDGLIKAKKAGRATIFVYANGCENPKYSPNFMLIVDRSDDTEPAEDPNPDNPDWGDIRDSNIKAFFGYDPSKMPSDTWYYIGEQVIADSDTDLLDLEPIYTGSKITFDDSVSVFYGNKILTKGTDYTISYANNINANYKETNLPKVTIRLKGKHSGTRTFNFDIGKASLSEAKITSEKIIPIAKGNKKLSSIKVSAAFNGKALKAGSDYNLIYVGDDVDNPSKVVLNEVDARYSIRLEATENGNFIDESEEEVVVLVVNPKDVIMASKFKFGNEKGKALSFTYGDITEETAFEDLFHDGKACVFYKNKALSFEEDYFIELIESDYTTIGTHKLRLIGSDGGGTNFVGTKIVTFKITPYNITKNADERLTIDVGDAEYQRGGAKPEVTVFFNGPKGEVALEQGVDYTVSYKNNKKAADSEAKNPPTVIIKGK